MKKIIVLLVVLLNFNNKIKSSNLSTALNKSLLGIKKQLGSPVGSPDYKILAPDFKRIVKAIFELLGLKTETPNIFSLSYSTFKFAKKIATELTKNRLVPAIFTEEQFKNYQIVRDAFIKKSFQGPKGSMDYQLYLALIQELENSTLSVAENEEIWNKKIEEVEIESLAIQEAEAKTEQDIRKIVEKLLEDKQLSLEETTLYSNNQERVSYWLTEYAKLKENLIQSSLLMTQAQKQLLDTMQVRFKATFLEEIILARTSLNTADVLAKATKAAQASHQASQKIKTAQEILDTIKAKYKGFDSPDYTGVEFVTQFNGMLRNWQEQGILKGLENTPEYKSIKLKYDKAKETIKADLAFKLLTKQSTKQSLLNLAGQDIKYFNTELIKYNGGNEEVSDMQNKLVAIIKKINSGKLTKQDIDFIKQFEFSFSKKIFLAAREQAAREQAAREQAAKEAKEAKDAQASYVKSLENNKALAQKLKEAQEKLSNLEETHRLAELRLAEIRAIEK